MNRIFKLTLSAVALAAGLVGTAQADEWPTTGSQFVFLIPPNDPGDNGPATGSFSDATVPQYFVEEVDVFAVPTSPFYYSLDLPSTPGISITGVSLTYYAQNDTLLPLTVTNNATDTWAITPDAYLSGTFSFFVYGVAQPGAVLSGDVYSATTPVPEPGAWSLLLAGLLGVAAVARRRQA